MCLAAPGLAQVSTDNPASTATGKGTAADGTRPADGAIKGGAIVPGDLTGTLREECLAQERNVSAGGTRLPEVVAKPPPAREAPPPQNPAPLRN